MSSHVDSQTAPINFLYSYLVGEVFFPLGRGKSRALKSLKAVSQIRSKISKHSQFLLTIQKFRSYSSTI